MKLVRIRFADSAMERRALGHLFGRFSFKSWETGEMVLPDAALSSLALAGIKFQVEGPAKYEQYIPAVRNPAATAV
jgi:hypothetical protein